jgi:mRNA interferase RelE/StbE
MKTLYQPSFIKDLKALKSTSVFRQINKLVFEDIPNYQTLDDISNLKKLKDEDSAYRIRIGDYRIGVISDGDTIIFERVLHRREIYRYFP